MDNGACVVMSRLLKYAVGSKQVAVGSRSFTAGGLLNNQTI